ncbi:MAG: hypothetical protein J1F39_05795 [Clostridiales bacterium]|nr:hypothetical protein [Clostridiales bacterium]
MNSKTCICCGKVFPAEKVLHCRSCGCCFCERCAEKLNGTECAKDLTYFD